MKKAIKEHDEEVIYLSGIIEKIQANNNYILVEKNEHGSYHFLINTQQGDPGSYEWLLLHEVLSFKNRAQVRSSHNLDLDTFNLDTCEYYLIKPEEIFKYVMIRI